MSVVWSIAAFLVAIGVLVTVHEAGHFAVARWCNVRVRRFSIGFGRPLLRWRGRGEDATEYTLAAIPLGGYVQMLDEREEEVAPAERHRAFNNRPLGQRAAIVAAGPAVNFLFAVLVYWAVAVIGATELRPVIDEPAPGTPAAAAGLERGQELVRIDGEPTPTWQRVAIALLDAGFKREDVPLLLREPSGETVRASLDLRAEPALQESTDILGTVGLDAYTPELPPTIGKLVAGAPAEAAGLRTGDTIVAVGGEPVETWQALVERVEPLPGESVTLTYERGGEQRQATATLGSRERGGQAVGMLGVGPRIPEGFQERLQHEIRYGPVAGLGRALERTWQTTAVTAKMFARMVVGEASLKNIGGPVTIGQYAGDSAALGLVPFLTFLGLISISLGLINLLPIPILDGGHLLYFLIEGVRGRPLSERAQSIGLRIGIAILAGLMGLAFYNDFHRLFG
ncbi:RIP metalloprotease RseP [Halorhodospira neutriphila]|uniref:Zinc metalloprotease n=1 Tax=Halorhodospira neutriphila TaxID=168379 RepID=A0ABS1E1F6_9GAMM|nr:RIP metalloprotease RseP [Halorhodospira neutriphila]MBK1725536.1 RIP metalloprotease RseP [Halorhodospira neutriphila]